MDKNTCQSKRQQRTEREVLCKSNLRQSAVKVRLAGSKEQFMAAHKESALSAELNVHLVHNLLLLSNQRWIVPNEKEKKERYFI